ncbi:MAG: LEA type 2 family protein [Sediminibacterium sp.]
MKSILLFGLIIVLLASCSTPQGFDYRDVKNVKIENMGFDKTVLAMDLVYYNPNGFGVDLKKVDCDVYVDNSYLGKFQLDTLMHIPRRSEFSLPSKIVVDMKSVLKNGLNLLFSQEVLVNVKGTTRVGKAGFYTTVPFDYSARHKLSLF